MGKKKRGSSSGKRSARTADEASPGSTSPIDLVVLSIGDGEAHCRFVGMDVRVTLKTRLAWNLVPGEIAVVKPNRQWRPGKPQMSGRVETVRLDVGALGLVPLRLEERGVWDPSETFRDEEDEPIEEWAAPIVERGARPMFEMEQVLPGLDPKDMDSDPTSRAVEHWEVGDFETALRILMDLCEADLRCIDAHAHLANFAFESSLKNAIRHYDVGMRIAELSLPDGFDGLLPWICIDNRPYLRCLHGYGLCMWRCRLFDEAQRVFERMLWLNPNDNQGARLLLGPVRAREDWKDAHDGRQDVVSGPCAGPGNSGTVLRCRT